MEQFYSDIEKVQQRVSMLSKDCPNESGIFLGYFLNMADEILSALEYDS